MKCENAGAALSVMRLFKQYTCKQCCKVFKARDTRAQFCGNSCRMAYRYANTKAQLLIEKNGVIASDHAGDVSMSKPLIALLVAIPMVTSGEEIFGTVAMVHDGDTITKQLALGID